MVNEPSIADIVLIGPVSVGKSTVGRVLAEKLTLPLVSMDAHRFDYYRELGYDEEFARKIRVEEGPEGVYRYWKVFDAYSVERLLEDHRGWVIDMGAGSTICEFTDQLERVGAALAPYPNVVLLLPYESREKSLSFLNERTGHSDEDRNANWHFVRHKSNYELAKRTVLVADRTPEEVAGDVLEACGLQDPKGVS